MEFARIIVDSMKNARMEKIQDEEIYQDFFNALGQSLFLEAHEAD